MIFCAGIPIYHDKLISSKPPRFHPLACHDRIGYVRDKKGCLSLKQTLPIRTECAFRKGKKTPPPLITLFYFCLFWLVFDNLLSSLSLSGRRPSYPKRRHPPPNRLHLADSFELNHLTVFDQCIRSSWFTFSSISPNNHGKKGRKTQKIQIQVSPSKQQP
jgi:hypothetical protein